jgi:hypothetical protein
LNDHYFNSYFSFDNDQHCINDKIRIKLMVTLHNHWIEICVVLLILKSQMKKNYCDIHYTNTINILAHTYTVTTYKLLLSVTLYDIMNSLYATT